MATSIVPVNENFGRNYEFSAGQKGKKGFLVGGRTGDQLHISFSIEKTDTKTQNTAKVDIWNLSPAHVAELEKSKCIVALKAGYGEHMSLIFAGQVSFCSTINDNADRKTHIEIVDNLISTQDTYVTVSYKGKVTWRKIFDDTAKKMGVAISYSANALKALQKTLSKGYSYTGLAKNIFSKGCKCCGLTWSIQNGIVQVKKKNDSMSKVGYLLSSDTGMIGIPEKVTITDPDNSSKTYTGWDVTCFLNGAINVNDYVKLKSKTKSGYFYVCSQQIEGDNVSGDWISRLRLRQLVKKK